MVKIYAVAFVWMAMALVASLVSIRVGVSVALVEILVGAIAGNLPHAASRRPSSNRRSPLAS